MRKIWVKRCVFGFFAVFLGGCFLLTAPPAPENLSASDGEYLDQVLITWSAARGASRYEVLRATEEDGDYVKIGEVAATRFSDTAAAPNVLYWYRVRACNQFGCSALSPADSGWRVGQEAPRAPQNVQASDGTFSDRIRVTWTASVGAASYEIWRSDARDAQYFTIGTAVGTTYEDRDVIRGRTYWYKVKACNQYGCSDFSAPDQGVAALQVPAAPQNVRASDGTYSDRVRVTWNAVSGAALYEVHRATSQNGTYELIGDTNSTTYDDGTVNVGTTYWYKVRAWNVLGYGPFSEADSGYAAAAGGGGGGGVGTLPWQPQNVQASDGTYDDKIRVTWSAVSGATYYELWHSATGVEGSFGLLATNLTTTSYDDTTQTAPCAVKWYRVRACNAQGCGPASVADSGYPGGTLAQVTNLKATTTQTPSFQVTLTWNAVAKADKFQVQYEIWRTEPGVPWREITQTAATTFTENLPWSGSLAGTAYTYKVRAVSTFPCISPGPFSADVAVVVPYNPNPPLSLSRE